MIVVGAAINGETLRKASWPFEGGGSDPASETPNIHRRYVLEGTNLVIWAWWTEQLREHAAMVIRLCC